MTDFSPMTDDQLDEWLAMNVMGWHLVVEDVLDHRIKHEYWGDENNTWMDDYDNWQPATDLNQAVKCAEKLANGQTFRIWYEYYEPDKKWHCGFAIPPIAERGYAVNPARALSEAIAMAKEGETK